VWVLYLLHEQEGAGHEVADCLVVHQPLRHGLADGFDHELARAQLRRPVEQLELHVGHLVKRRVRLVVGVDKVLNLGHTELAHSKETAAGRNLVAEPEPDLKNAASTKEARKKHAGARSNQAAHMQQPSSTHAATKAHRVNKSSQLLQQSTAGRKRAPGQRQRASSCH